VLTEIIRHLAQGEHADQLVLKGGQALRHVYGSVRFSKDADYVAKRHLEFDELRAAIDVRYPRLTLPDEPEGYTSHGIKIAPIGYRSLLGLKDATVELEVSFRQDLVLEPQTQTYESPFGEAFEVQVMDLNEMVSEKIRALFQRGHPRDLYDLWFIFTRLAGQVDEATVARLVPQKIRRPMVKRRWDYGELYDRIEANASQWQSLLRGLVPDPPSYEEALAAAQRNLRFLRGLDAAR
jgi:predicted nucleotidyltransferase component of viral defense system